MYPIFPARKETAREKLLKEEQKILESVAEKTALMGVAELALGIEYQEPIKTGCVESSIYMGVAQNIIIVSITLPTWKMISI